LAPTNARTAWEFARACFDWAEYATNNTQRAALAEQGIAAGRSAVSNAPEQAAGYYYLGANLGQLARTRTLGALTIVNEMEQLFLQARQRDERLDFSGPDRNLGLLYFNAPGWPVSVGNRGKARKHLQRAAELSPNFPDNRLNLLQALIRWKEKKDIPTELKALEKLMPRASKDFSGEEWEASVHDWQRRWPELRAKAAELMKDSP
jgi:tetratricopeptide (TPR) repeat protein